MESGTDPAVVGAQLRAARAAAGFSLSELAERVPFSRAALGHYETGRRVPTADVVTAYRRACGPLDAVTTVEALGHADLGRRGFLRSAAYSATLAATALLPVPEYARLAVIGERSTTGAADVAAVRGVTDALLRFDEIRGGGAGRTAMTAFLSTDVSTLLRSRFSDERVRAGAFSAAAELAYAIGFSSHDVGADGAALRYFLAALRLAEESGVPGQDGFVLRIIALHAGDVGMPQHSVELAERSIARARGHVDVDVQAVFDVALARTYAECGDHRAARETLRRVEPWLTAATTTELPRWLSLFCPNKASIGRQASKAFAALGDLSEAERHLHLSAAAWNPETHTRIRALSEIETGLLRWKLGRHEDAAKLWRSALPVVAGVDSDRTRKAVAKVAAVAPEMAV